MTSASASGRRILASSTARWQYYYRFEEWTFFYCRYLNTRNKPWVQQEQIIYFQSSVIHSSPSENTFVILYEHGIVWSNFRSVSDFRLWRFQTKQILCRLNVKAPCHVDLKVRNRVFKKMFKKYSDVPLRFPLVRNHPWIVLFQCGWSTVDMARESYNTHGEGNHITWMRYLNDHFRSSCPTLT